MEWAPGGSTVLEVVPPTLKSGLEGLYSRISRVRRLVANGDFDAINIPEIIDEENRNDRGVRVQSFAPRMEPRELGRRIQDELGLPVIVNRVVAFEPLAAQMDWIRETVAGFGIQNVVLVGAPHDRKEWAGPSVSEANAAFRNDFSSDRLKIGNICIPGREGSPIPESARMEDKSQNGANFFTTQIIFDPSDIIQLRKELLANGCSARKLPMLVSLCPVRRQRNLAFLRYLGVKIDDRLEQDLASLPMKECLQKSMEILSTIQSELVENEGDPQDLGPLGWNIAPVGQIPITSILKLMEQLPGSLQA